MVLTAAEKAMVNDINWLTYQFQRAVMTEAWAHRLQVRRVAVQLWETWNWHRWLIEYRHDGPVGVVQEWAANNQSDFVYNWWTQWHQRVRDAMPPGGPPLTPAQLRRLMSDTAEDLNRLYDLFH